MQINIVKQVIYVKVGDRVYYVVSGREIRPATIKWIPGQVYLLEYGYGGNSGAICLPASRVFESKEAAEEYIIALEQRNSGPGRPFVLNPSYEYRQAYDYCGKP